MTISRKSHRVTVLETKLAPFQDYLRKVERALRRGDATEHTHRPALKEFIESLDEKVIATNEPKRFACGAPANATTSSSVAADVSRLTAKGKQSEPTHVGCHEKTNGRALGDEGQAGYQGIIWALMETDRLMSEIDASI